MAFKKIDSKMNLPEMEEEILKFWEENKIFNKSLEKDAPNGEYVFYDGPPFATGTPHYGHIVASLMKDTVPRFWTMKGYRVERKWGWDCHGLPIENIAEKELGIKKKKEIEEMGVEKFNEFCRSKVLKYVGEWKTVINRLGRWANMENSYKTMDWPFMESVWWVFKQLWDKGLIYEGHRTMHICTRCETTLSQSEIAEGYKDIKDLSATVKFELVDEPGTFVLAWTTTPWTLIGNVALAINPDVIYCKVKSQKPARIATQSVADGSKVKSETQNSKVEEYYILAKERLPEILRETKNGIVGEFKGKKLVGKEYKPLFNYYQEKGLENEENGWKIYAGDFVSTEEGTGVVHIAPAFGEDDAVLGQKYKLPFVQHVGYDGIIKAEAVDFAGMSVKPEKDHQSTDVEVIKYLAKNNLLFSKEKYAHSYPHCWRCETPLINYATSSWFVNVEKIKKDLLKNAKGINWIPKHIKEGRFGNWLEAARDWSISRQRYWASVMPIWRCDKCDNIKVIGSVDEIREGFGNPNKLFLVRHGEAENNTNKIINSIELERFSLTKKGEAQVEELAEYLEDKKMDLIICSPFKRTKQTAEIISHKIKANIEFDDRLKEVNCGEFEGKSWKDFTEKYPFYLCPEKMDAHGVEGLEDAQKRLSSFLQDLNEKFKNKNILIISHGTTLKVLRGLLLKESNEETLKDQMPANGSINLFYSKPVDLHKHIVDKITFPCEKCGPSTGSGQAGVMKRIPDVLDTWFDSGSMPYAQAHYPFDPSSISSHDSDNYGAGNKEKLGPLKGFPAQFIAEGVDQTRCWFYYLHVISDAIKDSKAFENVIVNGIVLAEDGKKMAKRLKNYPDPMDMFQKYGADAVRLYLLSSPVMAAENINFRELEVAEMVRGMFRMLWNSYSFFVLYANIDGFDPTRGVETHYNASLLDKWIISELQMLIKNVNANMENYDLPRATRLFSPFIDNLSNWYIRRSRKRFWKSENDEDKNEAYATLHYVLITLAKLMAPFTPFIAEEIYRNLTGKESVHLADWPKFDEKLIDDDLIDGMLSVRQIITAGLQKRADAKIKVRQPLNKAIIRIDLAQVYRNIIRDELNVKEVAYVVTDTGDRSMGDKWNYLHDVDLDTIITSNLKLEGQAREIVRYIQEMRKEAGFEVDNRIKVCYVGGSAVFEKFGDLIAKETLAEELKSGNLENADLEKEFDLDGEKLKISIKKI